MYAFKYNYIFSVMPLKNKSPDDWDGFLSSNFVCEAHVKVKFSCLYHEWLRNGIKKWYLDVLSDFFSFFNFGSLGRGGWLLKKIKVEFRINIFIICTVKMSLFVYHKNSITSLLKMKFQEELAFRNIRSMTIISAH